MARLSELVRGISEALKVDERSVTLCARYLREAGLIAQKGRGPSAAHMTPCDAVNLLLGVMAAPEIKDVAECVKRVREATFTGHAQGPDIEKVGLPDIPWLWRGGKKPTHRGKNMLLPLGDALDAIMGSNFMIPYPDIGADVPMLNFFLTIDRPGTRAQIEISDGSRHWKMDYSRNRNLTKTQIKKVIQEGQGMQTSTKIKANELFAIADVLEK